ncbi:MAG: aminotransferase class V-fold PLP-dependent enzyme [Gammaproteobacteria bacterium]|jgi:aspartate aminotransferase-like enzyme
MPGLRAEVDPDGLLEYSVVFTDRSLNHMSAAFQAVMNDISDGLKGVYGAEAAAVVPGGGTFAMEAVARQFAGDRRCLIVRNGWFSYRWTQILEMGGFAAGSTVLKARRSGEGATAPFVPAPVEEVVETIRAERPGVVFAPHVETSAGMLLPDDYLRPIAAAVREVDGIFVLDSVASGCLWVDMREIGVDVLISAPQKGWSSTPCAGLVMLGARALERTASTSSSSFACDLAKWLAIMQAYENGGHAYHATMPTDGLRQFRDAMRETEAFGYETARQSQLELGTRVRALLETAGYPSVAAAGFQAPGVVVSYTDDPDIQNGSRFAERGLQIAAGVPLMCDEPEDYRSFRIGLFGLDKLADIDGTVARLREALDSL